MFKNKERKFLICTDVAARGIDVSGLPFSKSPVRFAYSAANSNFTLLLLLLLL